METYENTLFQLNLSVYNLLKSVQNDVNLEYLNQISIVISNLITDLKKYTDKKMVVLFYCKYKYSGIIETIMCYDTKVLFVIWDYNHFISYLPCWITVDNIIYKDNHSICDIYYNKSIYTGSDLHMFEYIKNAIKDLFYYPNVLCINPDKYELMTELINIGRTTI